MGTAEEVDSVVACGLVVSDLDENVVVPLREAYSRPTMPVSKDEEYRMTLHLFGAVSSPSCVNFAMR